MKAAPAFKSFFVKAGHAIKFAAKKTGLFLWAVLCAIGRFIARLWKHKQGRVGLIILGILVIVALFAPLIAPYNPYDVTQRADKGLTPSWSHLLGTSITTGQDIFSMLVYGTRVSLSIGIITGVLIAILGATLGVIAGYLGGIADTIIMRLVDIMIVIPSLPLVIVITNIFGNSYFVIVFVFVLFGWQSLARVIRSQVLLLKNSDYVKAAELAGASKPYIMFRHILPGVSNLVIMSSALTCAGIMIAESGLSFLGLANATSISWGKMLADAQSGGAMLFGHWWSILAPGIGIFLSVFAFMRLGLALEEILNPRMKRKSGLFKVFKHLNNRYLDEVFASMDDGYIKPEPAAEEKEAETTSDPNAAPKKEEVAAAEEPTKKERRKRNGKRS